MKARAFVRSLGLKSSTEWASFTKTDRLPPDIPAAPNMVYRNQGWAGYGAWIGTGTIATHLREYKPFAEARIFVQSMGLKSQKDWQAFAKTDRLPSDIPATPAMTYRDQGWAGYGDWLGTGAVATHLRKYKFFYEARAFVQILGLKNQKDWQAFAKTDRLPSDIPATPAKTYRYQGWAGYGDWLGTGTIAVSKRTFRPFAGARKYARSLRLRFKEDWMTLSKNRHLPQDIPSSPPRTYNGKGWVNWADWLGTKRGDGILSQQKNATITRTNQERRVTVAKRMAEPNPSRSSVVAASRAKRDKQTQQRGS